MKNLICIVCPKGCHLTVDEENNFSVKGNGCEKGLKYGVDELTHPERTLTSTVIIKNGIHNRIPVKTNKAIPKEKIMDCMKQLDNVVLIAPVKKGDVIIKNIENTNSDIIACRDM